MVIFSQYKAALGTIAGQLKSSVVVDGDTPMEKRQAAVVAFQAGEIDAFVGNIKAAGVGITLTRSSNVYFVDLDWTPASHDQAADRCHRIGQEGTVNVRYYIAEDTLEEDIMEMLDSKREVIAKVLAGEEIGRHEAEGVGDVISKLAKKI